MRLRKRQTHNQPGINFLRPIVVRILLFCVYNLSRRELSVAPRFYSFLGLTPAGPRQLCYVTLSVQLPSVMLSLSSPLCSLYIWVRQASSLHLATTPILKGTRRLPSYNPSAVFWVWL